MANSIHNTLAHPAHLTETQQRIIKKALDQLFCMDRTGLSKEQRSLLDGVLFSLSDIVGEDAK